MKIRFINQTVNIKDVKCGSVVFIPHNLGQKHDTENVDPGHVVGFSKNSGGEIIIGVENYVPSNSAQTEFKPQLRFFHPANLFWYVET